MCHVAALKNSECCITHTKRLLRRYRVFGSPPSFPHSFEYLRIAQDVELGWDSTVTVTNF
jgi:hypothetical protein